MGFKASRGFAIGLFACVYGVAKWSNSQELRYFAMIFSVMLLAVTIMLKWWNKRQHRISQDPLAIPGPKSADPVSGNLSQLSKCGSLHEYIKALNHIYGPIGAFYWGTQRIAYISSQSILSDIQNKEILQNLDSKPLFLYQALKPLIGIHSIEYANGNIYHSKMTKIFNKIYSTQNIHKLLYNQYKSINKHINNKWITQLDNKPNNIDIETDLFTFATQTLFYTIFGNDNNMELITDIMNNYNICYKEMEQRLINGLPPDENRIKIFEKSVKQLRFGINKMLDLNMKTDMKNDNLFAYFKTNEELYANRQCILDEIITIIAGVYKIYYGLLWMCYFIGKHNDIQNKIMDEITSVFNDEKDEKEFEIFDSDKCKEYMNKLMELKYCKNVIIETLRITSIKSWTARVCNDSDIILNTLKANGKKVKIPAKMAIVLGLGAINTNKKEWDNGYTFIPERFKDKVDKNWNVFGGLGGRMCPGAKLFEMEALMFMVNVLRKFKLGLKVAIGENKSGIRPKYGLLTKPNKAIEFIVSKRQFAML